MSVEFRELPSLNYTSTTTLSKITWRLFLALAFFVGASAPAGFYTTLSWLTFLFAVIALLRRFAVEKNLPNLTEQERLALAIFGYLVITILWSDSVLLGLKGILEYRVFFMSVACSLLFRQDNYDWRDPLKFFIIGATLSLIFSYGLYLDFWEIEGKPDARSKGDRIYHGIIMVSLICLLASSISKKFSLLKYPNLEWVKFILIMLALFNVVGVEIGRTAYFTLSGGVVAWFILYSRRNLSWFLFSFPVLILSAYLLVPEFAMRVNETYTQTYAYFLSNSVSDSPGIRLELYSWAIQKVWASPWFGYGVGDVSLVMEQAYQEGFLLINADNVHNEFLNFGLMGGLPLSGLLVYVGWSYCRASIKCNTHNSPTKIFTLLFVVFAIHMLFNSAIKDLGEKTLLMILLVTFFMSVDTLARKKANGF